jgi:protein-disulfide isomerase
MRRGFFAVLAMGLAASWAAGGIPKDTLERFTLAYMDYAPDSTVELRVDFSNDAPGHAYSAVTAVRRSGDKNTDQLSLLYDPETDLVAAGLGLPIPPTNPRVSDATLPAFVQQLLPQLLQQAFGAPVKVSWPGVPTRPSGVIPLTAEVSTGYGFSAMPLAISADGSYLILGSTWPLDRDPRAVRREILSHAVIQWDPGHENAPLRLVEFSDYECPACKRGWSDVKPVLERLGDKVRHGVVDYPLVRNHPWAFHASVGGLCVGRQDPSLLIPFKEEMYRLQDTLTVKTIDEEVFAFASQRSLDLKAFRACYMKDDAVNTVVGQIETGQRLGIVGTPTYYVNGELMAFHDHDAAAKRMEAIAAAGGVPERAP